jgi:hypothetical protein
MKTWNGTVRLAPVRILPGKRLRLVVTALPGHPPALGGTILTPGQAMRLANQLRRWAMGNLRRAPRDSGWPIDPPTTE